MTDLELLLRSELRARADDVTPRPGWSDELLRQAERRTPDRRPLVLAAIAASIVIALLAWGLSRGTSDPVEPIDQLPVPAPLPLPDSSGVPMFLAAVGTGADARLYELTQPKGCEFDCPPTLWSSSDSDSTRLHEFAPGQLVYAVAMDPASGAGLAFESGVSRVLRTADGGRTWVREEQEFALYGFPADVVFMDGSIYLYAVRWSGGLPSRDDSPHLWRSPVDSDEWTEVELPSSASGFVHPVEALDGSTAGLLLVDARESGQKLGWTYDGSSWTRVDTTLPCDSLSELIPGPSAFYLWCRSKNEMTLQRSVDLQSFEVVAKDVMTARNLSRTGGPYPIAGRDAVEHPVLLVLDGTARLLLDDGTSVEVDPLLRHLTLTSALSLSHSTHARGTTYLLGSNGGIVMTTDGGRTWVRP